MEKKRLDELGCGVEGENKLKITDKDIEYIRLIIKNSKSSLEACILSCEYCMEKKHEK